MKVTVTNAPDHKRYEARADGELAGLAEYLVTDDVVTFTHTEVLDGFEGKGVASTLVRHALDDVRRQGRAVVAVCPFVSDYIHRHPEYADLLYRSRTGTIHD